MCRKCKPDKVALMAKSGGSLDTLAQRGTKSVDGDDFKLNKSTAKNDLRRLKNRAKRKYLSSSLSLDLISTLEQKIKADLDKAIRLDGGKSTANLDKHIQRSLKDDKLMKSFWNMFYCASKLERVGGSVTGRYCKNRLCLVCNSIRQAKNMNDYSPVIDKWGDVVYMVTLTIPNMESKNLADSIKFMVDTFALIKRKYRKRHVRGTQEKFVGIKKIECTYNAKADTYHPHFHILVKGKEMSNLLLADWLEATKGRGTLRKAQDVRKADFGSSMELFKYMTKIVSTSQSGKKLVYAKALIHIFSSLQGVRTFDRFGFNLPKSEADRKEVESELLEIDVDGTPNDSYTWVQSVGDWCSGVTGELLSNHKPSESLKELTRNIVRPKIDDW